MLKAERHRFILERLQEESFLKIVDIAEEMNVSEMTIRRDFEELASENKLIKLHGGARKIDTLKKERSTNEKLHLELGKKEYIGNVLNSYIPENSIIFLAAGTTVYHALPYINKKSLTIITNNLIAFEYLTEHTEYTVNLVAGEYIKRTNEFVGEYAELFFKNVNIDIAFVTTNGIYNDNVTTASAKQVTLQDIVLAKSHLKYLVADSTKFNRSDMYTSCRVSSLNGIITDNEISEENYRHYSKYTTIINKAKKEYKQ